jgi:putative peptidoglycan lipid II flippase
LRSNGPTPTGTAIAIESIRSFDPEVNPPTENEDRVRLAVDGDPNTTWSTDRYRGARFGGLKKGLGLIVVLTKTQRLSRLEVTSRTRGWSAAVYVANGAKARLADWGKPVAEGSAIAGSQIFNLQSAKGGAVLLWITDPGQTSQLEIAELALRG